MTNDSGILTEPVWIRKIMLRDKLYYLARLLSFAVMMGVAAMLVIAFIKRGSRIQPPPPIDKGRGRLSEKVVAISFKRGEMNGSSIGAILQTKEKKLALLKDADLVVMPTDKKKGQLPIEIRGQRADYTQLDGVARFFGAVSVTQGEQLARADQ